jgi:hypothetical protein
MLIVDSEEKFDPVTHLSFAFLHLLKEIHNPKQPQGEVAS